MSLPEKILTMNGTLASDTCTPSETPNTKREGNPLKNGPVSSVVTKTTLLHGNDPESKREEILHYFHQSFSLYESLFECLVNDDAYYQRASPLRHPLIFYYGHTAVFFINKLNVANPVSYTHLTLPTILLV